MGGGRKEGQGQTVKLGALRMRVCACVCNAGDATSKRVRKRSVFIPHVRGWDLGLANVLPFLSLSLSLCVSV